MLTRQLLSPKQTASIMFALALIPGALACLDQAASSLLFANCYPVLQGWLSSAYPYIFFSLPVCLGLGFLIGIAMVIRALFRKEGRQSSISTLVVFILVAIGGFYLFALSLSFAGPVGRYVPPESMIWNRLIDVYAEMDVQYQSWTPASSCTDTSSPFVREGIPALLERAEEINGGQPATCHSDAEGWAITVPLPQPKHGLLCPSVPKSALQLCIDNTYQTGDLNNERHIIDGPLTGTSCFGPASKTATEPVSTSGGVYDVHKVDCVPQDVYDLWVESGMRVESGDSPVGVCPN